MNRRGFLKALGIGAAAAATGGIALLEQELWTPTRTFFLPPVGGWRGNQLLTIAMITKEALRILENELVVQGWASGGALNVGDVVTIGAEGADRRKYAVNVCRPPRYAFQQLNQIVHEWRA